MTKSARCLFVLVIVLFAINIANAEEKKAGNKKQVAELRFLILKESNEKPIRNASVVLHPVHKDGAQSKAGLQLKTDEEGKTTISDIPFGKIRVQVIAPGMQTYGQDYVIDKESMEFTIKLSRPTDQFTIYK